MTINGEAPQLDTEGLNENGADQASTSESTAIDSAGQPAHWNSDWRHFWLKRKTDDEKRRPWFEVENNRCPEYWNGDSGPWSDLVECVDDGDDVGFLPWRNDIMVIDCDVKKYFVTDEDNSKTASMVVKYGIDDLEREVVKRGHSMAELETYTVSTKSGGFHLYFALDGRAGFTKHHREEWRNDVIGSVRSWVAAPPTPGYEVVKDVPVIPMPDWLYALCRDINQLRPVGGRKRVVLDERVRQARFAATPIVAGESLMVTYIRANLELIKLADQHGGWNETIFQVACDFFDMGFEWSQVEEHILEAAAPWNDREKRNALGTIRSARRYKTGDRS